MAVVSVNIISEGLRSWKELGAGRGYTVQYLVILDDPTDSPGVARTAGGIPEVGDAYAWDVTATCKRVEATVASESRLKYIVSVDYETPTANTPTSDDPLTDPVQIHWTTQIRTEVLDKDIYGTNVRNSAGDKFDPPLVQDLYDPLVTITRNELVYNPAFAQSYRGAVNEDYVIIAGMPAALAQALCLQYDADSEVRNGIAFWRVTYQIAFRAETWARGLLDLGMREITVAGDLTSDKTWIKDDQDREVREAVRLNGLGQPLANDAAAGIYGSFATYPLKEFGLLGLNV